MCYTWYNNTMIKEKSNSKTSKVKLNKESQNIYNPNIDKQNKDSQNKDSQNKDSQNKDSQNKDAQNKDSQKKKMSKKKKARLAAMVAVVLDICIIFILVYSVVQTNGRLSEANSKLNYLSDNTDILMSEVNNLHTEFGTMLEDEASLLESCSIEVVDTDFRQGVYTVDVTVIPKEYTEKTQSTIYFGTRELKLKLEGYKFVGKTVLPLSETYKDNVTVLFVDGNKRRTEQLTAFDGLYNDFDGILTAGTKELPKYKDGKLKLSSPIDYELDGKSRFEFKRFELAIRVNGIEISKFDMTATNRNEKSDEKKDTEKSETPGDLATTSLEKNISNSITGTYVSNEDIVVPEDANVRIYFRAVTTEGFRFEFDVFNGKTKKDGEEGFEDSEDYFKSNACVYDVRSGKLELQNE